MTASFKASLLFCAMLVTLGSVACGPRQTPTSTATGVTTAPHRIISIGPAITEILIALGASQRIVAADDWSQLPAGANVPRLGEPYPAGDAISPTIGIDLDVLEALRPDIVIADVSAWTRLREGTTVGTRHLCSPPALQRLGKILICTDTVGAVDDMLETVLAIGKAVGESGRAEALVTGYRTRIHATTQKFQGRPPVRVLVLRQLVPPGPIVPVAGEEPLEELIGLAGGVNVFTNSPEYSEAAQRWVQDPSSAPLYTAKNPEVILFLFLVDQIDFHRLGWSSVEAVRQGRIHKLGKITPMNVPDRLEELANLLHPGTIGSQPTPTPTLTSTPTPTPKRGLTEPPKPVPEVALRGIFALGDTVIVTVAIIGPVVAEPSVTLDGKSSDEVKRNARTLEITHVFRQVKEGEHQVHVSGGNLSQSERIVVGQTKAPIPGLRPCQILPAAAPTPVPPGVPTPTPTPFLEIELRSVEAFDGHMRAVFWFGPGGYGSVSLDGNLPDVIRPPGGFPGEFIFLFLAAGGGDHVLLAQGYPHRLEVNVRCPIP